MGAIVPIPTSRVSDLLIRQRLQTQLQSDQGDLLRLQDQLSSGRRINLPSEDAPAALRAVGLQSLIERKAQNLRNITANDLFLQTTDSALTNLSTLVTNVRASALSAVGTTSSDSQRQAVALEVQSALGQLVDAANQQIGGRYLFSGSKTNVRPYTLVGDTVQYDGNEEHVQSYADLDLLFQTNLTGNQVFGGISEAVRSSVDLNPTLTRKTLLSDIRGGVGFSRGSIEISDGTNTSIVDLSKANTIGDVVDLIEANPPLARSVRVDVTSTGLNLTLNAGPGNFSVSEVGDGSTAASLGIDRSTTVGNVPIVGSDLDPRLAITTSLKDVLGTRAQTVIQPAGIKNDLIVTATRRGAAYNGAVVSFVNGPLGTAGNETAVYNSTTNTLTVTIESGVSTANQIITAINNEGTFHAELDYHEALNDGTGVVQATLSDPLATGTTAGGSGIEFDQTAGLQITNGGKTTTISLAADDTIEDLLNTLNSPDSGLSAQINAAGTGLDVRSIVSGADFAIGENGGATATQLGLRTFTTATSLHTLNHGQGVQLTNGTDLVIQRRDGTSLNLDLDGASTIGDVLNLINNAAGNQNPATQVVARLSAYGNGIELVDNNPTATPQPLQVSRVTGSQAAQDLGLIPVGANTSLPATPGVAASATLAPAGANNDIRITALGNGTSFNGLNVSFVDTGLGAGNETVTYNAGAQTLVFDITAGVTTANDIVNLLNTDAVTAPLFSAALVASDGSPNSGAGTYGLTTTATFAGGVSDILTGRDPNPQEVDSVFNALLRLEAALESNDEPGIERAIALLDNASFKLTYAQADSGARQQGVDLLKARLDNEDTNLKDALSTDLDTDMAETITNLVARQTSYQAALQTTAQTFKLTLLDFL